MSQLMLLTNAEISVILYPVIRLQKLAWPVTGGVPAGAPFFICQGHAARQLQNGDYEEYDLLIGMDRANFRDMHRICGGDFAGKIPLLMEYAGHPNQEVADPWYTGDFEANWNDVLAGCQGLLRTLTEETV